MNLGNGRYLLQPMPTGSVSINRLTNARLQLHVDMFGLTPGSAHHVFIKEPDGHQVAFPPLTANAAGQAGTTLTSLRSVAWHTGAGQVYVELGDASSSLAAEPIAMASVLPPQQAPHRSFTLHGVAVGPAGQSYGDPGGHAAISYDPRARKLTVKINAHGLNPGPHAAHIHLGSCLSQGAVKYMLADFVADSHGNIINEIRTVSDVPPVQSHSAWYLNLHQGGMNQILANGAPTLSFRPLLCANITKIARARAA